MDQFSEDELKALASQLRKPEGDFGLEVGEIMNVNNSEMTRRTILSLDLDENDCVLELGHGNCGHLSNLMSLAPNLTYCGLDISELMHQEAQVQNKSFIDKAKIAFQLYNGTDIPFENDHFTKIMTVNTIYFWENPTKLCSEIYRVLHENGSFSLCFGEQEFMSNLPFTRYGFELYDMKKALSLIESVGFKLENTFNHTDFVKTKTGEEVHRPFIVMVFKK